MVITGVAQNAITKDRPYGEIEEVHAVVGDRSEGEETWRMHREMGGGALYDLGVYSINALRYASGAEPVRVRSARQWAERPELFRDADEITEFELELSSGIVVMHGASVQELRPRRTACRIGASPPQYAA